MKKALFFLIVVGIIFSGIAISNVKVSATEFQPGSSGTVTLTVTNTATGSSLVDDLTGVALTNYPPSALVVDDSIFVGDIDSSSSTTISFPFQVKENAKNQIYILEVRATAYSKTTSTATSQSFYTSSFISIPVVLTPFFSLSTSEESISDIGNLSLTLSNKGGSARNVRIKVIDSNFALFGTDEMFFQNVSGSVSFQSTIDSRKAIQGPNTINFSLSYDDQLGNSHEEIRSVRIAVRKEQLNLDFIQESSLITRKEGELNLLITNNGNKDLSNIRFFFNDPNIKLKQLNELQVGDLSSKAQKTISVKIVPELSPGLNEVLILVKWYEGAVEKEQSLNIPLKITSDADVSVYLDAKPSPLRVGQEHTISVLVSNIGSYKVDNVDVSLSSSALELLDIENKEYVGSLDPDDFNKVQFKINVKNVNLGPHDLVVNVNYRDPSGEWASKQIVTTILINEPLSSESNPAIYLILIAIVVITVWYFKFRKK